MADTMVLADAARTQELFGKKFSRDPPAAVYDAKDGHEFSIRRMFINDDVRGNDADANILPESGARRAAVRVI